jgi:hypothetical protein
VLVTKYWDAAAAARSTGGVAHVRVPPPSPNSIGKQIPWIDWEISYGFERWCASPNSIGKLPWIEPGLKTPLDWSAGVLNRDAEQVP